MKICIVSVSMLSDFLSLSMTLVAMTQCHGGIFSFQMICRCSAIPCLTGKQRQHSINVVIFATHKHNIQPILCCSSPSLYFMLSSLCFHPVLVLLFLSPAHQG
ncbi:hypothetical protein XENORESO_013498 [Xenotaenia resolanae]|uniref:Secreted protein n=1 Tax=Xenotaenia resolanae TaxID=208358 RepID=A0ABV0W0L1_9TELE